MLATAAAVALIALGAAGIKTLTSGDENQAGVSANDQPAATPTATAKATATADPAKGGPADERCTPEIKANQRWVCLISAKFKGETLTIRYQANFAGAEPNVHGGYHLHIYGGDGVTPAAEIEGRQAMNPGHWYVEDEQPSVRRASREDFRTAIGNAPKVCARIASAAHILVPDENGTYVTGNCVRIDRSGFVPPAPRATARPSPTTSPPPSTTPTTTTPPTTAPPTPTPPIATPTDLTFSTS